MSVQIGGRRQSRPELQYDGLYLEQPPVQNEWNTVLDEKGVLEIDNVYYSQQNTDNAAKDIEFKATIDGEVYPGSKSSVAGYAYSVYLDVLNELSLLSQRTSLYGSKPFLAYGAVESLDSAGTPLKCRAFKFELRITSALGTNQVVFAKVKWHKSV